MDSSDESGKPGRESTIYQLHVSLVSCRPTLHCTVCYSTHVLLYTVHCFILQYCATLCHMALYCVLCVHVHCFTLCTASYCAAAVLHSVLQLHTATLKYPHCTVLCTTTVALHCTILQNSHCTAKKTALYLQCDENTVIFYKVHSCTYNTTFVFNL